MKPGGNRNPNPIVGRMECPCCGKHISVTPNWRLRPHKQHGKRDCLGPTEAVVFEAVMEYWMSLEAPTDRAHR